VCSEPWVAYLTRAPRQRRCREAPPIAVGPGESLFIDVAGRLLACGRQVDDPTPVTAMAGVRVRSVAAGSGHSFASPRMAASTRGAATAMAR
jgi:hypothetical protein